MLACTSTQTVLQSTLHSLCLDYKSRTKGFGIEQDCRVCIHGLGRKTKINVFGKIVVQNGRYPVPALWVEPYTAAKDSLSKLFDEFLVGACVKEEHAQTGGNDESSLLNTVMDIVKLSGAEEYSKYLILFMFVILLINTMILWNLVMAAQRNQREILTLTRLMAEVNAKL